MSAFTLRLPNSVHQTIKELAARDEISVNQFIASAAAEKMATVLTLDHLRREADEGQREDFLQVLDRVPEAPPLSGDEWLEA
ncbi:HicB family protein [Thiorhodovibrio winogradskyi]|uniref:HicB family protein n=1 Tax=Thiorhodovibrio winogradskyi TaxID=77007 RepID=A0ABZ0SFP0_9GAMM|nr:toxin-antitoxin system HicB family antitoxin [Thiorhodovibrio winogradskyi]